MYIRLPEAMAAVGGINPNTKAYVFLCSKEDYKFLPFEPGTIRFHERRRKKFSDVNHVKLVGPPNYNAFPYFIGKAGSNIVVPYFRYCNPSGSQMRAAATYGQNAYYLNTDYTTVTRNRKYIVTVDIELFRFKSRDNTYIQYRQVSTPSESIYVNITWTKSNGVWTYRVNQATTNIRNITGIVMVLSHPENGSVSSIVQDIVKTVEPIAQSACQSSDWTGRSGRARFYKVEYTWPKLQSDDLLNEYEVIFNGMPDILLGSGNPAYWRNVGIQNAYLEAVKDVPRLNDNNLSNILEIVSFIKGIVIDHKINMPKGLTDAWLAYRYQYKTSESDFNEAIRFFHRRVDVDIGAPIKSYGSYSISYHNTQCTFRCCLISQPKQLALLEKVWTSLYKYGLSPSFYAIWDMIPYSFIVDWFIPIGNVASVYDAQRVYIDDRKISDVIFSITYDVETELGQEHHYTRWLSSTPPSLKGYYFLEESPSNKVIGMRILDAMSLAIR